MYYVTNDSILIKIKKGKSYRYYNEEKVMNINDIKDKNYLYFKDNFESITVGHLDQYVVIYDCKVYGYYLSMEEAIKIMQNNDISIGSFIVQKCTDNINTPYAIYYSTYVNDYTLINLFGK